MFGSRKKSSAATYEGVNTKVYKEMFLSRVERFHKHFINCYKENVEGLNTNV